MTHLIMIDNYDSFTYNLVDEIRSMGYPLTIFRNDVPVETIAAHIEKIGAGNVILLLSPGPGKPSEAGNMPVLLKTYAGQLPILGICLGHQAIVEHYGGIVGHAGETIHGKTSSLSMNEHPIFEGLPQQASIARYHSLVATQVPECLNIIATVGDIPMAVTHHSDPVIGFQFHPESILTTHGARLLKQTLTHLLGADDHV
ncbi:aminodeoxychorismate/anthranilate synthase component II [Algicola sagamiensis]|uniref:aminodeoxychorismate/anthranilate synthase component II n=1 Tax=Algicola sagamiensis TaxID=163869 RepID=UPI00037F70B9|nr:aminodeoxychorismate/anthranilate synthase component II [Algicola sagamiensis]